MPIAAPSQTDIVNGALAELGSTEVLLSIDGNSNSARRVRQFWPEVLRTMLADHPWNFALKRTYLLEDGTPPDFGFKRRFRLPVDLVRWLPFAEGDDAYRRAEREGSFLLADEPGPMPCRYIAYVDDTSTWPPHFATAMKFALAASLAEGITQSESIKDRMVERMREALSRAKRRDGLETGHSERSRPTVSSRWLRARQGAYLGDDRR